MDKVARLLNDMVEAGIIKDYAVFGAVTDKEISELATRHDLASTWRIFLERFDES